MGDRHLRPGAAVAHGNGALRILGVRIVARQRLPDHVFPVGRERVVAHAGLLDADGAVEGDVHEVAVGPEDQGAVDQRVRRGKARGIGREGLEKHDRRREAQLCRRGI